MAQRQAILSLIVDQWGGMHPGAWRDESAPTDPAMDFERIKEMARTAERGKFHCFFLADSLGYAMEKEPELLSLTSNAARFEPFTLATALAAVTSRIGLALTASTTYSDPYNVARMFASLDHLSAGRAGWNIVTSTGEAAPNFNGLELSRDLRYERAEEFYDVVAGLWDSFDDDAFSRNKTSGEYFDDSKVNILDHKGKHFSVEGPLNITRPPQGHPVIAQAGASPAGVAFASRVAELMFVYAGDLESSKAFYADVKAKAEEHGRDPDHLKILPSLLLVLGRTQEEADEKLARLDSLADPRIGIERLKGLVGYDFSGHDLDAKVPEIAQTDLWSASMQDHFLGMARENDWSIRQLVLEAMRFGVVAMSVDSVVSHIDESVTNSAADGFNVCFGDASGSLDLFVDEVVPELQRRGLFHEDYRGRTFRENLGLPHKPSTFSSPAPAAIA